jgi:pilus assembly protein TadC
MSWIEFLAKKNPAFEKQMITAHINKTPEEYLRETFKVAGMAAGGFGFLSMMLVIKLKMNLVLIPLAFIFYFVVAFLFFYQLPKGKIRQREREINKEILFAGRYLLVKLESGMPLYNALIDISRSYGVAAKYFREIVNDIETGTPIEEALENSREFNASKKFKRIMWVIVTALKTGIDVSDSLKTCLKDITEEQVIEIKAYGKTMNSIMLFYMIIGCVLPSLGFALFTIFVSFLQFEITNTFIAFMLFMFFVMQMCFIAVIKATRPMVNL